MKQYSFKFCQCEPRRKPSWNPDRRMSFSSSSMAFFSVRRCTKEKRWLGCVFVLAADYPPATGSTEKGSSYNDHERLVNAGFGNDDWLILRDIDIGRNVRVTLGLTARRILGRRDVEPDAQPV